MKNNFTGALELANQVISGYSLRVPLNIHLLVKSSSKYSFTR